MAKKLAVLAVTALVTAGMVFAQELEISGEMKTGFFWEKVLIDGVETDEDGRIFNNDDAGANEGRFRLNLHLHKDNNMGMKVRFEQLEWTTSAPNKWAYAMAYGNFVNEQLRVTIGKLGESPWGAGGPDLWDELDNQVGIRFEVMPTIIPGFDVGFVLNTYNTAPYDKSEIDNLLVDILKETVLGIAYTNDYFHGRLAYRLDGDGDIDYRAQDSQGNPLIIEDNMRLIYRLEERIIRQYLENFSVFANGYWAGIGEDPNMDYQTSSYSFKNWLYINYAPSAFSTRLSLGLDFTKGLQLFKGRAQLYYNILPFLSAGAAVYYWQKFGEQAPDDNKPFEKWGIEPQVRVTFNANAYIAFVYNYEQENATEGQIDRVLKDRHWINLRVVYTF